jgi:hypothetical protein
MRFYRFMASYQGEVPNPAYHTAFETFEYVEKFVDPTFLVSPLTDYSLPLS